MILTCKHVCEHASDFIDGAASLRQRLLLRLHLFLCKHCRRYLRQFRTVIGIVPKLATRDTPSDEEIDRLVARLMSPPREPRL